MAGNDAFRDNLHSRVVAWLKIIFPLTALGLLSTLFLLSRSSDPINSIPFAKFDLKERAHDQRMTAPKFSGVSANGDQINFSADTARPDPKNPKRALAEYIISEITLVNGATITFSADMGVIDEPLDIVTLQGSVIIKSSTGYVVRTEKLTSGMRTVSGETDGFIQANGPIGRFSAGKMVLTSDPETGTTHLVFTNGVKLVYKPIEAPQSPKE